MTNSDYADLIQAAQEAVETQEEVHLTIDQVATQLGVSSQTVRNWEKSGKLIPDIRTEGGHRRYRQRQINEFRRAHNDFEIFIRIEPAKLLSKIEQIFSMFRPDEKICLTIRNDEPNRQVHFTLDSEDGLCTYTKTLKMEE